MDGYENTFEELLASILLEECFVNGRSRQVINHKVDNRLNLLLCVTCIIRNSGILSSNLLASAIDRVELIICTYPLATIKHESRQIHGSSSNMTGAICHESVVQQANLRKILANGT